jgi:uncharacterized repeat protein (TIGR01451 family)
MEKRHQLVILIVLLILPGTFVTGVAGSELRSQSAAAVCGVDTWDYEVLYDFEADDGGFIANTPPGEWEWGTPTSPPAAHSGDNVWATNLAGNITSEPSRHRLTKTVTLATFSAGQLQWWDWWDEDGTDQGRVLINGQEVYFVDADQLAWTVHTVDLTPWQGHTVDIVFEHFSYPSGEGGPGWYIDDVALQSCDPTPTPDLQFSSMNAPTTAAAGVPINYTVSLFNSGAQDAAGSTVVDSLPIGTAYVAGSATNGAAYNSATHEIEWTGTVPAAQTVAISFQLTSGTAGNLSNVATINHASLSEPLILTSETQVAAAVQYPMCEGFENGSGMLPATMIAETTTNSTATGRVAVTGDYPYTGQYALNLDTDCGGLCGVGTFTTQAAILAADLAGQSQVELNFQVLSHGDEAHPQDGVFISDNSGLNYTKIYDFSVLPSHYHNVIINLSQAAADAGLALNEGFLIKFQSFDNDKIDLDGFSFDDICLQRLNQPELTVEPTPLTSIQTPNTERQRPLTLNNNGGGALNWRLFEAGAAVHIQGPKIEDTAVTQSDAAVQAARPEMAELARDEAPALDIRPLYDLLYDQSDHVTTLRGVNSQEYEASYSDFDSQAADDFIVPEGDGSWSVHAVEAFGEYQSSNGQEGFAPAVNVSFYRDDNGLPGAAVYTAEGLPPTFDYDGSFVVELPMPALLVPGTYWFSIQADMDVTAGGQWSWFERTEQTGNEFAWRNPGGGFERGCLDWGSSGTCDFDRPDLGFRLAGSRDDCRPQTISWITLPNTNGTVNSDSEGAIPVLFNSGGLAFDSFEGELCLISNDPAMPVRTISLEMIVQETAEFVTFFPVTARQE